MSWALLPVVLLVASADSVALPSLAVLTLQARNGISPDVAAIVTDELTVALRRSGRFSRVVATTEVAGLLNAEQQSQAANCDDTSCLVEIAGALGVDQLAAGSVGRAGSIFVMNVRLISARTGTTLSAVQRTVPATDESALVLAVPALTQELTATPAVTPLPPAAPSPTTPEPLTATPRAPPPAWARALWSISALTAGALVPACGLATLVLVGGVSGLFLPLDPEDPRFQLFDVAVGGACLLGTAAGLGLCASTTVVPVVTLLRGRGGYTLVDRIVVGGMVVLGAVTAVGSLLPVLVSSFFPFRVYIVFASKQQPTTTDSYLAWAWVALNALGITMLLTGITVAAAGVVSLVAGNVAWGAE
ncbi:MAG: hypothetical protein AB2A00_22610 [Myxococcota bacterium]